MKKFMKGCAALALIFAILGFALAFVGSGVAGSVVIAETVEMATGGRIRPDKWDRWELWDFWDRSSDEDRMTDTAYGGDYDDFDNAVAFDNSRQILSGDVEKFCVGNTVRNMELTAGDCYFDIVASEDDSIWVEAVNARKFQCYVEGDTLYVNTSGPRKLGESRQYITLYVPEGYRFDSAELESGAGIMMLSEVNAEDVVLEVGAGSIDVESIRAGKLDVYVGAGTVTIMDMEIGELYAEAGMGNFVAEGDITQYVFAECAMGNIQLALKGGEADFNYDLEASMGGIDVGNRSYSGLAQEKYIDNGAEKNLCAECSMGNITISFTGK